MSRVNAVELDQLDKYYHTYPFHPHFQAMGRMEKVIGGAQSSMYEYGVVRGWNAILSYRTILTTTIRYYILCKLVG